MNTIETVFRLMLDVSWRSSLLIVAVLAIRAVVQRRVPAWIVHAAWIAVTVRLLFPASFEAGWSPFGPATKAASMREMPGAFTQDATVAIHGVSGLVNTAGPAPAPAAHVTLAQWIAVVWIAGVAFLLLMRAAAYVRFTSASRRSGSPARASLVDAMASVAAEREEPALQVWESDAVSTPALHGLIRPRLLFPRGMAGRLAPSALRMIIEHEVAHVGRRDLIAQALTQVATAVHWFNPLVWIAARVARTDCELACDETVMRRFSASQRETYGSTLIQVVSLARSSRPQLGLGVVESRHQLKRRIQMIARQNPSAPIRAAIGVTAFLAIAVVSLSKEPATQPNNPAHPDQMEQAAQAESADQAAKRAAESRAIGASGADKLKDEAEAPGTRDAGLHFRYGPDSDGLDNRFPGGVIATVDDRTITVADVRREAEGLIPQLQRESGSQDDFDRRLRLLQNDIVGHLLNRVLVVNQFHEHSETIPEKHVPAKYVDEAIADITKDRFDNDPAKLDAYLQTRGITMDAYRREVEEDIIFGYMKAQERKLLHKQQGESANSGS